MPWVTRAVAKLLALHANAKYLKQTRIRQGIFKHVSNVVQKHFSGKSFVEIVFKVTR